MYIKKLTLKNYRNYESLDVSFDKKVNIIIGNNAQGKTNLIESIYVSSFGKSFRTNKDSDLVCFDKEMARIEVEAAKEYFDTKVEILIKKDSKKSIKKDGVNIRKTSELLNNIMTVIFSPEDLKIVKEDPEKRRKFIDRELCQIKPAYYENLNNYKKALAQRNMYLKEEDIDSSILDLWDVQLARYGSKIISIREKFIEEIGNYSNRIHNSITDGKESLFIEYNPNINYAENADDIEGIFYDEIKRAFYNDIKQRTTTKGPHKDDISFYVNGINMRSFGSQGQQRTCALSLKLAELNLIKKETGEDAILLLDDVMSELDVYRQQYMIKTLNENQIFVTATDVDDKVLEAFAKSNVMTIERGKLL